MIDIARQGPFALPDLLWAELPLAALPSDPRGLWLRDSAAPGAGLAGQFAIALPPSLDGAVAKRRREYLGGRLAAAHVLRRLGAPEILGQAGRAPIWPAGVVGSISHDDHNALAVASRHFARLGVDREQIIADDQARALADQILAPGDAALRPQGLGFGAFLTLVFSAKEALYKAVSAEFGRMIGFHEARLAGLAAGRLQLALAGQAYGLLWHLGPAGCTTLCASPLSPASDRIL